MSHDNSTAVASAVIKTPSVMRYDRVQVILDSEPCLRDFMGPKDQEVTKRNKEKHYYSRGVVIVTNALHERGIDAHQAKPNVVLRLADELLIDKKAALKAKPLQLVQKPDSKAEPQVPVTTKPEKNNKPVRQKPAVAKRPQPKPKVEAKQQEAKPTPTVEPPPAAPVAAPAAAPVAAPVKDSKPGYVYYVYATALSLAVSIHKMLEIGDRMPGAEGRLEAASKLLDELKPMSNVGVPMPEEFDNALKHDNGDTSKG